MPPALKQVGRTGSAVQRWSGCEVMVVMLSKPAVAVATSVPSQEQLSKKYSPSWLWQSLRAKTSMRLQQRHR